MSSLTHSHTHMSHGELYDSLASAALCSESLLHFFCPSLLLSLSPSLSFFSPFPSRQGAQALMQINRAPLITMQSIYNKAR